MCYSKDRYFQQICTKYIETDIKILINQSFFEHILIQTKWRKLKVYQSPKNWR